MSRPRTIGLVAPALEQAEIAAANARPYAVVRGGVRTTVPSRDITVGDILVLEENDEVPADCVVLEVTPLARELIVRAAALPADWQTSPRTIMRSKSRAYRCTSFCKRLSLSVPH